ncbi:FTR1 family iron permease [Paenibacillus agricola]|uniref:FTR1 family iron permease n=1 Tax=Paenibacillus agricola TaxID=2716264 RepID=A0ABX0JHS1_9BACL|nr:FTR1 family protein [Paenibacillus agricola]NHN33401.1 FTR1 family iron permease [Paenibacillus agricola]
MNKRRGWFVIKPVWHVIIITFLLMLIGGGIGSAANDVNAAAVQATEDAEAGTAAVVAMASARTTAAATPVPAATAVAAAPQVESLLPITGGAIVHAGQQDWPEAAKELAQFEAEWQAIAPSASVLSGNVDAALAAAQRALKDAAAQPDQAYQAISLLTKATGAYVAAQQPATAKADGKALAKTLLPALQQTLDAVRRNDIAKAKSEYKRFDGQWSKAEGAIRSDHKAAYGAIETKHSLARIALQAEPPRMDEALTGITDLMKQIEDYSNGQLQQVDSASANENYTIGDVLQLLQQAQAAVLAGDPSSAVGHLQRFIQIWPSVEGAVSTRDPGVYAKIENEMTEAAGQLLSKPPQTEAASVGIATMISELEPFQSLSSYTAWDAALILLREGVEALLVLVSLLAFLNRTGNGAKQKWVWWGSFTGLLLSGALAMLLTFTMASIAAGSTREMIEGVTGLVSVVMLLTVGAWLHGKTQAQSWNRYIQGRVGGALENGNLWTLFVVAGLAILREGAETTIFYIGMAPSIATDQLLLGIGCAFAVLLLLGYVMVKGSLKLPIRPFFIVATVLIYYLVFKFLGQSIHSLQVAGSLSAHTLPKLPAWSWLGFYPTWESTLPQLAILVFIGWRMKRTG